MLERLTDTQAAWLPVIRDEWVAIGLSTAPADRAAAEEGVRLAYDAAGLAPPSLVVWLRSPREGVVGASLLAQVRDQVWAQVRDQVYRCGYGLHDAGWLSFYAAVGACGVDAADRLRGLQTIARHAGWWWPFAGAVILSERPCRLSRDERGRLHAEDGPAIQYPDGWGVWAWHGVRVPQPSCET